MRFLLAIVAMIAFACFIVVEYKAGFCSTARELYIRIGAKTPVGAPPPARFAARRRSYSTSQNLTCSEFQKQYTMCI
jgi:hypothetical protein